jgi:phosphatidate cytidylyltransferase
MMGRTIPGILLAVGWLLLLAKGTFLLFWGVVAVIGLLGAREFCRMAFPHILYESDRVVLSVIFSVPILVAVFAASPSFVPSFGPLLGFLLVIGYVLYNFSRFESPFSILHRALLGLMFVGFLGSHLVMLRGLENGAHWLIILTGITAGSDTGAYYVGSSWGRRKLCPQISPNKTIEGGLGGIAGGVLAALLLSRFFSVEAGLFGLIALAALLAITGMVGDLLESVIKRGTGTKDSGTLLGGHGGILDRIDSLLLAGPVLYYALIFSGF